MKVTVVDSGGEPAANVGLRAFNQEFWETGQNGAIEASVPENWWGPFSLEVLDPDCGLIGYYASGGFTTLLEQAATFEVGAPGAVEVEIRLPKSQGDLCDSQELLGGTVLWPGGEPAEGIWLVASPFEIWALTGADGTFQIRLPEGTSGSVVIGVEPDPGVADCGWLGFHGPDGLTTIYEEATRVEIGAEDTTSIEIALPSGPDGLCN